MPGAGSPRAVGRACNQYLVLVTVAASAAAGQYPAPAHGPLQSDGQYPVLTTGLLVVSRQCPVLAAHKPLIAGAPAVSTRWAGAGSQAKKLQEL